MNIIAIDPGVSGGILLTDGEGFARFWPMPLVTEGKTRQVKFSQVLNILTAKERNPKHVFLERAVSFGMGMKQAFNYGYGFASVFIAIELSDLPVTLVEPAKWTKEMHSGISGDLKPKVKSQIACNRLYPQLVRKLPRGKKGIDEGACDALLIAGYGFRILSGIRENAKRCATPRASKSNATRGIIDDGDFY